MDVHWLMKKIEEWETSHASSLPTGLHKKIYGPGLFWENLKNHLKHNPTWAQGQRERQWRREEILPRLRHWIPSCQNSVLKLEWKAQLVVSPPTGKKGRTSCTGCGGLSRDLVPVLSDKENWRRKMTMCYVCLWTSKDRQCCKPLFVVSSTRESILSQLTPEGALE